MPQHEDHSPLVLREGSGHVAEIVLHRPHALNALSTQLMIELRQVCEAVQLDPNVRAVVLSGSGSRAFCAGADLKERNGFSEQDLLAQRPVFQAGFGAVRALSVPVVAAASSWRSPAT
jgi:enoyl-CoA hydratase/carnithine racemase